MKKLLSAVLSFSIGVSLFAGTVSRETKDITVEIDGKNIEFDVKPEIIDGRTMVPLRKIFEEIGALVKWDGDTRTVSARKNSKTITLVIDSADMDIDKGKTDEAGNPVIEIVTLDVPAQIVNERTLVPARAISESFGLNVDWDEDRRKVIITSEDDDDNTWTENIGSINLSDLTYEGEGIEISENQIKIMSGGDFTLTGTLEDGNITISTKEKVKVRLNGAKITSGNGPCIFVEKADKAYITLEDGTTNVLIAKDSEDGAIYSKENLEIKGDGSLDIESSAGHGIKASDNLNIEKGTININAESDGIHINDTFKMSGGTVNITATGDGIDSESIVNISGGEINIETNGTPIETEQPATQTPRRGMWEETADVEFEKSTKGIGAEWMLVVSDGEINVNSAAHAIHCGDEIEINGGKFVLSSEYEKGISAHGNLTINGSDTVIDVKKSTEGIESKKVMTINDGTIKVVSTDDALNATGGNSGMMMPGFGEKGEFAPPEGFERGERNPDMKPQFERPQNGEFAPPFEMPENGEFAPPSGKRPGMPGGFMEGRSDMKNCLVINDGYLELCGSDDCIDANGNIVINGGTIKATNPTGAFSGNFGVLDADGQTTISDAADIILASGGRTERSLTLKQNNITVYCENNHKAGEKITVLDSNGNVVCEYEPDGSYKAVLIASDSIKTGETYSITVGDEAFEAEIAGQSTVVGTQTNGDMGFGRAPLEK